MMLIKEREHWALKDVEGNPITKVYVLTIDQLSIKIFDRTVYDIWEWKDKYGQKQIAVRHSETVPRLDYYADDAEARLRDVYYKDSKKKEIKISSYTLTSLGDKWGWEARCELILDTDYKNFKASDINYLEISNSAKSIVFFKDSFK